MGTSSVPAPVAQTHAVLGTLWFPVQQLPIPPQILPEVEAIASQVCAGMLEAFSQSSFLGVLVGMTTPNSQTLPFFECLSQSTNPWVQQFLQTPGGVGGMPVDAVTQLL